MIKRVLCLLFGFLFIFSACNNSKAHFIESVEYRQKVEKQFDIQKKLAKNRADRLFKVLERSDVSIKEKEALKFLFAHMPLNDLADYDGDFFLKNVRMAFKAQQTFPWGKKVPHKLFRHFVLPYRVNNENLDDFRSVYFKELEKRVKHLSMKEAVLEVNHWCHEKVAYRGTDIRTSAPCSTIRSAFGRCGEESTFTVSALRMVGIPARQCYTPRWAHCDDNHAWVEAWVDGKWYYLGACEPEPDLDMAWFTEPVRRAMLVHTKVFGQYEGPEEVIVKTPQYTEINVINNYTKTKKLAVTVLNLDKQPVKDADVQFRLYNYAEFYPLAAKQTDAKGTCGLTTGLGDLLIWARKGDAFGFEKVSAAKTSAVEIVLDKDRAKEKILDWDMNPPVTPEPFAENEKGKEENDKRLEQEDKIRAEYEATFITEEKTLEIGAKTNLDPLAMWKVLEKSKGNWKAIAKVLEVPGSTLKPWVLPLLNGVSDKDLRDTPSDILISHLTRSFVHAGELPSSHKDIFIEYVLNPRVDNEIIVDYKMFLQEKFDKSFIDKARKDVWEIVKWINGNIALHDAVNYYRVPITPRGVYSLRAADRQSRDIFFVALCRSFGIPARLEQATKAPQYFDTVPGQWHGISFDKTQDSPNNTAKTTKGYLRFQYETDETGLVPLYYTHFTLSHFKGGQYRTLVFPYDQKVPDFPGKLEITPGHYLMITGNRLFEGNVLCKLRFFNVGENDVLDMPVKLRPSDGKTVHYGSMPLYPEIKEFIGEKEVKLADLAGKKGLIIGWLDPDREPTKHVMKEIRKWKESFDRWGGHLVFFIMKSKVTAALDDNYFKGLPERRMVSIDTRDGLLKELEKEVKRNFGSSYPVFISVDEKGKIKLLTKGYRIGIGELLVKSVL